VADLFEYNLGDSEVVVKVRFDGGVGLSGNNRQFEDAPSYREAVAPEGSMA
jgi:hypothetical protein